jgi:hypothetical protein
VTRWLLRLFGVRDGWRRCECGRMVRDDRPLRRSARDRYLAGDLTLEEFERALEREMVPQKTHGGLMWM